MRLVGQIKTGFYPTPPAVTDLIRTWIRFPAGPFAALDPCAGEGVALAQTLDGSQGIGYGVELDRERAREARGRLAHVLTGDWRTVRASVAAFSLCWTNPPYDDETGDDGSRAERKEHAWLRFWPEVMRTAPLQAVKAVAIRSGSVYEPWEAGR